MLIFSLGWSCFIEELAQKREELNKKIRDERKGFLGIRFKPIANLLKYFLTPARYLFIVCVKPEISND